jgi:hypothetical protein
MMHDRKFWDRKLGRSPPFFPPVAAGPAKFRSTQYGALLEVPSTGSIGSAIAAITRYSNTIYDGPGWESLGDNATLVTPSNPRIQLMRLHAACYVSNSTIFTGLRKYDGVSAYGRFNGDTLSRGESGGDTQTYLLSAILPAVAGERFQHWLETAVATSQQVQTDKNWFGVEVLAPGTRYTFLQKNTNQALSTAGTPLIWDVENVDTLGLWTSGANLVRPARPASCASPPAPSHSRRWPAPVPSRSTSTASRRSPTNMATAHRRPNI